MNDTPLWVTITLPAVGYVAAVVTELMRGGVERRGAREARDSQRAAAVLERRDLHEIKTINDAVEELNNLARLSMRIHLADMKAARETDGLYASHLISDDELNEDFRLANMRVRNLGRTLLDAECRAAMQAAHEALGAPSMMLGSDPRAAEAVMIDAQDKASDALDVLAGRLRAVYADGPAGGERVRRVVHLPFAPSGAPRRGSRHR